MAADFFKVQDYKSKDFKFPKDDVAPKDKVKNGTRGSDWFYRYFQAMYSEYVKDKGGIPYSRRNDFNMYRLYSDGNQPTEKYMDILAPKDPHTHSREGWMNISWDIVSVAPKFKRIFIGMFEKLEHDIVCSAINDKALADKEDAKWMLWAGKELQSFFSSLDAKMGIDTSSAQPEFIPENIQELEMWMNECFKLKTEMAMEMGIDYSFYLSNWTDIKKRMLDDAFTLGIMANQDYVDPVDDKIKVRYIDPNRLVIRYSEDPHFRNIDHWAYIQDITIAELRQSAPELTEEEIFDIAKNYSNYAENSTLYPFDFRDYYSVSSMTSMNNVELPYDNYRVNVMFAEMISTDTDVFQMRYSGDGVMRTYKEDYYFSKPNTDKRKVEKHKYQTVYKGWWVLGTKYMYNCGKQYDIPRPEKKRPALSLNIYRYSFKSILASIIPNLDSFQLSWLKLQNAKAMAAPAGLSIEVGTLENLAIGGKNMDPIDILTLRRQTGDLVYKATTHHSEVVSPNAGRPVTELQGGIGSQLAEYIQAMEYDINMIRQQTGMNEIVDSSNPNPDQAVRTSMLAVQAANNALQPVYSGYVTVKEQAAKKIALRYQIKARDGDIKGYLPSLGSNIMQVFKITSDVSFEDYAIKVQLKPTDEMKAAIGLQVQNAVQLGPKNGGISASDALYIEDKVENGNLKYARMYLSYKEKQYQKDAEKMQQDNMAANGQNMQAQQQAKDQGALQVIQAESQAKIQEITVQSQLKQQEDAAQHEYKLKEIAAQGQVEVGKVVATKAMEPDADNTKDS